MVCGSCGEEDPEVYLESTLAFCALCRGRMPEKDEAVVIEEEEEE